MEKKNHKSPLCHGLGNKLCMLHMEVLNIISFSDLSFVLCKF